MESDNYEKVLNEDKKSENSRIFKFSDDGFDNCAFPSTNNLISVLNHDDLKIEHLSQSSPEWKWLLKSFPLQSQRLLISFDLLFIFNIHDQSNHFSSSINALWYSKPKSLPLVSR